MNYEFKIWTREKKIRPAFVTLSALFLPDVKKKIVSIIQNIAWSQLKRSTQTAL